jgi:hypothetical protein
MSSKVAELRKQRFTSSQALDAQNWALLAARVELESAVVPMCEYTKVNEDIDDMKMRSVAEAVRFSMMRKNELGHAGRMSGEVSDVQSEVSESEKSEGHETNESDVVLKCPMCKLPEETMRVGPFMCGFTSCEFLHWIATGEE